VDLFWLDIIMPTMSVPDCIEANVTMVGPTHHWHCRCQINRYSAFSQHVVSQIKKNGYGKITVMNSTAHFQFVKAEIKITSSGDIHDDVWIRRFVESLVENRLSNF
jgi:hypothetical protein